MDDAVHHAGIAIDEHFANENAATRRRFVAGAAALFGSMGLLGGTAHATHRRGHDANSVETILTVGATAEALATIINTVGAERVTSLDATTKANVQAAARHELLHYQVWTSPAFGGKPVTTRFWIPDAVFASHQGLLTTLVVGDQVFVNAYLIAVTSLARMGGNQGGRLARIASEFMAVESVHRALALQSLGKLGNDRTYAKFTQREEVPNIPTTGAPGFLNITDAVGILESAGIGFGKEGSAPGAFYEFNEVSQRTPDPGHVNTRTPA